MEVDTGMVDPAMLTEETDGSERERCLVANQMASDLSGFSFETWCTTAARE